MEVVVVVVVVVVIVVAVVVVVVVVVVVILPCKTIMNCADGITIPDRQTLELKRKK